MCGRAAQTHRAVSEAAHSLGCDRSSWTHANVEDTITTSKSDHNHTPLLSSNVHSEESVYDNFNMSPGMDAFVFWKATEVGKIKLARKTWGLVTRHGSQASPIPAGMNLHFSNMMFNARSDTLWEKPTFSRLAAKGKSCLIALDGFFEWKELGKGQKKQPYYVYRRRQSSSSRQDEDMEKHERNYLLMAGLWTSVSTGRGSDGSELDTFTIVTTDVCKPLEWLHTRMPLCVWDEKLALEWLEHPTRGVLQRMEQECVATSEALIDWHAVSPDMSSLKFRSRDALRPMAAPIKITSFFQKKANMTGPKKGYSETGQKRDGASTFSISTSKKLKTDHADDALHQQSKQSSKKGPLDCYFSSKKKEPTVANR